MSRVFWSIASALLLNGCAHSDSDNAQASAQPAARPEPVPAPLTSPEPYRLIECPELKQRLDAGANWLLVDVRSTGGYRQEHLPGAVNIPFGRLDERYSELPKDRPLVLYCA
jgi:3-mercaptopyruvate sulfurtransferase SseA